jgi:serralysin
MYSPTYLEILFVELVNEARVNAGVKPLTFDGELLDASDFHSAWMDQTGTFSHTGVNGSSAGDRMTAAGYGWQGWGENIGYVNGPLGEAAVRQLHADLMNSPGHYANIVNGTFEEIGIGLKEGTINGRNVVFVTQNFGTPNATEQAEADDVGAPIQTVRTFYGWSGGNLMGTDGIDAMFGGAGDDTYFVNDVNDRAYEYAGEGYDTVISSVDYNMPLSLVDRITLTGSADLSAMGNYLNNTITGNAGANRIEGAGGNDIINGKGGKDILNGGDGGDTFVFDTAAEARGDTIEDFAWDVWGLDKIDLSNIDANVNVEGDQAFTYIGTERFHKVAGELHMYYWADGNTYLSGDTNGDGVPEFAIKVLGYGMFRPESFVL